MVVEAVVEPLEPPEPPKITRDEAKKLAESLARGTPRKRRRAARIAAGAGVAALAAYLVGRR